MPLKVQRVNSESLISPAMPPSVPALSTRPVKVQSIARTPVPSATSPPAGALVAVKIDALAVQLVRVTTGVSAETALDHPET